MEKNKEKREEDFIPLESLKVPNQQIDTFVEERKDKWKYDMDCIDLRDLDKELREAISFGMKLGEEKALQEVDEEVLTIEAEEPSNYPDQQNPIYHITGRLYDFIQSKRKMLNQ